MGKKNISNRVAKLENNARPEVKYNDGVSGAFDTVGSINGTLLQPQELAQGTGRNQRVGDKVKTRNIRFQAIFKMPANPANSTTALRILVLRSKLTLPDTSDMPNWWEPVDEDKFFVVKDVLTQVSAIQARTVTGTSFQTGSTLKKIKFNIPTGMRKVQYDGGGVNTLPLNNEYVIYMFAENQSAEVAYNWRHYYIDN
jgi:hypothetical protein